MRSSSRTWTTLASVLLACGPVPTEVTQLTEGTTTGASTGMATTSVTTTAGTSSATTVGIGGSHDTTGPDGDTTAGVQLGTSTSEPGTSTGEPGTSTSTPGTSTGEPGTSTGDGPTCDELFGAAPNYLLCMETPTECHFATTTGGGTCNQMCAMFSSTCLDAIDNSDGCNPIKPDTDTCDTPRSTEICVCSK